MSDTNFSQYFVSFVIFEQKYREATPKKYTFIVKAMINPTLIFFFNIIHLLSFSIFLFKTKKDWHLLCKLC